MRKASCKFLGVSVAISLLLAFLVLCVCLSPRSHLGLSVTYLQTIDGHGHWRLQFGITNVGTSAVFTSKLGEIEVLNHTNLLSVGATSPLSILPPGEGQVVDAVLSETEMDSINAKWRFTCLYAEDGLRSRIYRWQWGPAGPGSRVNWLVPKALKGQRMTVKGTSGWIGPTKPLAGRNG